MKARFHALILATLFTLTITILTNAIEAARAQTAADAPATKPDAMIDLATEEGARAVKGVWRYSDTRIIEADFRSAGADQQPTGAPVKTYDYTPKAGAADFDDSQWEAIPATSLSQRRGNGRLWFNWYRLNLTVPARVGDFDPTGSTLVFETALDDYAEIWVDGELTRALGQRGGSVVAGWNAANRLVIGRNVRPGQRIQLAVFGINGPLSNPPTNFIWVRYAKLEFYKDTASGVPETTAPLALAPSEVNIEVKRLDPAMDEVVGANPKLFKLADGFQFTEGPVWTGDALLFSDPNSNIIWRYTPDSVNSNQAGRLTVFRAPSGYSGADIAAYGQPGANGLALDSQGRLTINQHGNRRVVRLEKDGGETVLAAHFDGRRLNSPNDLVYRADGALFFTDPPFGLPKFFADPRKELPFSGVYALYKNKLQLLSRELAGPNGIALSPDEKHLYVGNWDETKKVVMRYEVSADATLRNGKVFFDMTAAAGEEAIDGIKVDRKGNLYVSGPGGLWVISAAGKHLGTIIAPKHIHNFAWGDADGKTLYLCARASLYRMRLNIPGSRVSGNALAAGLQN